MINQVSIKNYKSILDLDIATKRVNIFIGEHNSGKSNILEALNWFSLNAFDPEVFKEIFRFKTATDFFYDFDGTKSIEIKTNEISAMIRYAKNGQGALMNNFEGILSTKDFDLNEALKDINNIKGISSEYSTFQLNFDGSLSRFGVGSIQSPFKTYSFKRIKTFSNGFRPFLNPPFGDNIPSLLISNKKYKDLISDLFKEKGFRLMLKPTEGDFSMAKDVNDELYSFPYVTISETMQRIVFYMLAIETNKDSVIVLDEPESNTFPMYTKQMAELIALDKSNQYFIATHNPYLLGSLVSKTPMDELAVFVTKMDNYETHALPVSNEKLSQLLDDGIDFFFNLDNLVE